MIGLGIVVTGFSMVDPSDNQMKRVTNFRLGGTLTSVDGRPHWQNADGTHEALEFGPYVPPGPGEWVCNYPDDIDR